MQTYEYDTLNIRISPHNGDGAYDVAVSGSGGQANSSFTLPFDRAALKEVELRVTRPQPTSRRLPSEDAADLKRFGGQLFAAVFGGRDVHDVYRTSLDRAETHDHGLRLTLQLSQAPDLMEVPWEFLFDDTDFIANSWRTPVVRKLDLARPAKPLEVELPLRVLVVVSNASDLPKLDTGQELVRLEAALKPLVAQDLLTLESSPAVLSDLLDVIDHFDPHVLHFGGHGAFSEDLGDGILGFVGPEGESDLVDGNKLATLLRNSSSLRLAVVNACEGSRSSRLDAFAGIAGNLIKRNVPAVIAMQYEITDDAAVLFASEFYEALANGQPVDAAVGRARMELFASKHELEWGTPVVFLQADEARVFEIREPPRRRRRSWRRLKLPRPRISRARVAAAAVAAIGAAAVAFLLLRQPPPKRKPHAPVAATVLPGTMNAGGRVTDGEYGFHAVWATQAEDALKLTPAGDRPLAYGFRKPGDVLVAGGFVWIGTADGVVRVDSSGAHPTLVRLPGHEVKVLTAAGGMIWVLVTGREIVSIDPNEPTPRASKPITVAKSAVALAASDSELYIGHDNGTLTVVEPSASRDDDLDPDPLSRDGIASLTVYDGDLFAMTKKGELLRRAPNGATRPAVHGVKNTGAAGFAVGFDSIWIPYTSDGVIRRFNARTGKGIAAPLHVGTNPDGVMLSLDRVFVVDLDGTVRTLVPK